ncbi:MAG: hypothetical protein ACREQL_07625, partial [Candidatus Binatia bacterium]
MPTGTPTPGCGNSIIDAGEDCDPPGSQCPNAATGILCDGTCQCACPGAVEFTGTSTGGILDTGWTGIAHDATVVSEGTVTVDITACAGASRPCGVCTFTGPIANQLAANYNTNTGTQMNDHRCSTNTRVTCGTGGEDVTCSGGALGTCEYYFGTLLPLSAGGVATCVQNQFNGTFSGTANIETGGSTSSPSLTSRVYGGATNPNPCPRCLGDGPPNDGVRGGTCSGGTDAGAACDVNGTSPTGPFGRTSLDCRPSTSVLAALPIDLTNTTGTASKTLTAANPNCRAVGHTASKCQCDTCNHLAATPCSSNADCVAVGATICGGPRCTTNNARQGLVCSPPGAAPNATCGICINGASTGANCTTPANCGAGTTCVSGTNAGAACTVASQCPGSGGFCGCSTGVCGFPGLATAPNQCDGGDTDCAAGGTPGPNDGVCLTGPTDSFCQPNATMILCTTDAECTAAGVSSCTGGGNAGAVCTVASECPGGTCDLDTCTGSKTRECYL